MTEPVISDDPPRFPALLWRRGEWRSRYRAQAPLSGDGAVDEAGFVPVGEIEQWRTLRGEDRSLPLLVVVHGGPGAPCSVLTPRLRAWERRFVVLQWDQPAAGKTLARSPGLPAAALSFERIARDGVELVRATLGRLGQRRAVLLGSSAGTIVALHMLRAAPTLFLAFVGADLNVGRDRDGEGLRWVATVLRRAGSGALARKLEALGPDSASWTRAQFDWRNRALVGAVPGVPHMVKDLLLPAMLTAPTHDLRDVRDILRGLGRSFAALHGQLQSFEAAALGLDFDQPFFVVQGALDLLTPPPPARRYFEAVRAPAKTFVELEGLGHLAAFFRPDLLLDLLETQVLPHT